MSEENKEKEKKVINADFLKAAGGQENAERLLNLADSIATDLCKSFEDVVVAHTGRARDAFKDALAKPEFDSNRATLLDSMRNHVLNEFSCRMIVYCTEVEADLGTKYSEFAAHAVGHLEIAYSNRLLPRAVGGLTSILRAILPSETLEKERLNTH